MPMKFSLCHSEPGVDNAFADQIERTLGISCTGANLQHQILTSVGDFDRPAAACWPLLV